MKKALVLFACTFFMTCFIFPYAHAQESAYRIAGTIQLTGDGWWDYLSVDEVNNKLFISHGTQVNVVDLKTSQEIAIIPQTNGVHGIAIANDLDRAFISCGMDSSVSVIVLSSLEPVAKVKVTGRNPDAILYDQFSKKIFTFNRLFSVCGNKLMTVTDANTGKVITTVPIGNGCDGVAFDNVSKRIYTSNGEGTITVIQQETADQYTVLENFPTQPGARTITLDKTSHHVYLSVGEYMPGTGRRPVKPNTFRVIDIEPIK